jgi:hypothetical protein
VSDDRNLLASGPKGFLQGQGTTDMIRVVMCEHNLLHMFSMAVIQCCQ